MPNRNGIVLIKYALKIIKHVAIWKHIYDLLSE